MLTVVACIRDHHDFRLLVLAAIICVAGSWVGIKTFIQARHAREVGARRVWTLIAACAIAAAEWTTHFLAMLAYKPGFYARWDLFVSAESFLIAFAAALVGLTIGTRRSIPAAPELGGSLIGIGLAAMHFLGMQAYEVQGHISWNSPLVVASIMIGLFFCALSLSRPSRPVTRFCKYGGALSLILGICGLHFTAMAAATLTFDPVVTIGPKSVSDLSLAIAVGAISVLIIGSAVAAYLLELRSVESASQRMAHLANATSDGLLLFRDGRVADANQNFLDLIGMPIERLRGIGSAHLWARHSKEADGTVPTAYESELLSGSGARLPVQIITSTISNGEQICTVRDLRAQRAADARIFHMAHYDPLTDLANRATFTSEVGEAIASGAPFALFFIDLDQFKEINDQYGHAVGDAVLVEIARRMVAVAPSGLCARLGGDELAIMKALPALDADDGAAQIVQALTAPFTYDDKLIRMGASIGCARWPRDGSDVSTVLANADTAMYAAKRERVELRRFDAAMGEKARRRCILSQDMAGALENADFIVYYQAQTDVVDGALKGFEALLRWPHPTLGFVPPAEFIPIAEENGLIAKIGSWVMAKACRDATAWPRDLTVAVNLSPAQFSEDLDQMILSALIETGLEPRRLEVEITESLLIENPARALAILRRIKDLGVSIAMDDFGTGYSSLQTLQSFPFDKIKIDRSFVEKLESNQQSQAIVRAVVGLGKSLSIPVLAEGVERESHLALLKELGCASAQGYLIGRPTPLHQTFDLVAHRRQTPQRAIGEIIEASSRVA